MERVLVTGGAGYIGSVLVPAMLARGHAVTIVDNFIPGEVYNVGGREDWAIAIEELGEIVLRETGADRALMQLADEEAFTTRVKVVDFSRARRDLGHDPTLDIDEGIRRYVAWARTIYA